MGSSLRYLGCAVGFGFGVVWMTMGLGAAILCLLLAGVGYGAVFAAERAQANSRRLSEETPEEDDLHLPTDDFDFDPVGYDEPADDATAPLAAEADYGWPLTHEEPEEQARVAAAPERGA
jgi:hypothetical protein